MCLGPFTQEVVSVWFVTFVLIWFTLAAAWEDHFDGNAEFSGPCAGEVSRDSFYCCCDLSASRGFFDWQIVGRFLKGWRIIRGLSCFKKK